MRGVNNVVKELAIQISATNLKRISHALVPERTSRSRIEVLRFVQPETRVECVQGRSLHLFLVVVFVEWAARRRIHHAVRERPAPVALESESHRHARNVPYFCIVTFIRPVISPGVSESCGVK